MGRVNFNLLSRGPANGLSEAQARTVAWFLARLAGQASAANELEAVIAPTWRHPALARFALAQQQALFGGCRSTRIELVSSGEVRCLLRDRRGGDAELLLSFESARSGRVSDWCVRPLLDDDVEVRSPGPDDIDEMQRLERAAPVQRDDGTEVVIDHNGRQFDRYAVVPAHRLLAAFKGGRMVALQGVAIASAPIGGAMCRFAYSHYTRSDPETRNSGYLLYIGATLFRKVYPDVDLTLYGVDTANSTGRRLSFGEPWPTRVRRLFLPVADLAAQVDPAAAPRVPFDPARAALLLNATHKGMNLWVPRSPRSLLDRCERAPRVYDGDCWRQTENAVLSLWAAGEQRLYRKAGQQTVRTLALALDYGFVGEQGRKELLDLLCEAAAELVGRGITHIALFISEDHPPTEWLAGLAEAEDTYAVCTPSLEWPAPPSGPVYADHIVF